jgi:hypothetical protein
LPAARPDLAAIRHGKDGAATYVLATSPPEQAGRCRRGRGGGVASSPTPERSCLITVEIQVKIRDMSPERLPIRERDPEPTDARIARDGTHL